MIHNDNPNMIYTVSEIENKMCRACLKKTTEVQSLFTKENDRPTNLINMFTPCTSLEIVKNDPYPKQLCSSCIQELTRAFEFYTKCHDSIKELNRIRNNVLNKEVHESLVENENVCTIKSTDETQLKKKSNMNTAKTMTKPDTIVHKDVSQKIKDKNNEQFGSETKCYRQIFVSNICKNKKLTKTCHRCHICFYNIEEYKEHIKIHNTHLCPHCGRICKSRGGFQAHIASHSDSQPHECKTCGKKYKSTSSLQVHMRNHSGEKRYTCEHCNKKFITWSSKTSHIRIHHMNERPHICQICNKAFKQSGTLIVHMRQHTGEKPYQCPECPMAFCSTSDRKCHMLRHTGEKNHACKLCNKRFARSNNLKQHMVTHTGERKHSCKVCGKAFTQAHVLRSHMRTHGDVMRNV